MLACWEAAANAVEHGASASAEVLIDVQSRGGEIRVSVADSGAWLERSGDRGLGLGLIRALMDHVEITRTGEPARRS